MSARHNLGLLTCGLALVVASGARADQINPARLELREVETGIFEVTFALPVVGGRRLRAEPELPDTCRDLEERSVEATASAYEATWRVACDPASLAGEAVVIRGLVGTLVDIFLQIETLDGRVYSEVLKPANAAFVVPHPPRAATLIRQAAVAGSRRPLRQVELWVLAMLVGWWIRRPRSLAQVALAYAAAHAAGQAAAVTGWLTISAHTPVVVAALIAGLMTLDTVTHVLQERNRSAPARGLAMVLGLLQGGARPGTVSLAGLSSTEQGIAFLGHALGVAMGAALLLAIALELRRVLADRVQRSLGTVLLYTAGALAWGLGLYRSAAVSSTVAFVGEPGVLALMAVLVGAWMVSLDRMQWRRVTALVVVMLGVGCALGLARVPPPLGTSVSRAVMLLLGVALASGRRLPARWGAGLAALGTAAAAWQAGYVVADNVNQPLANGIGTAVFAACALYLAPRALQSRPLQSRVLVRVLGGAAALLAVTWRLQEYGAWLRDQVATELALGSIRLPLLALLLTLTAVALWPRRREALRKLGVDTRQPVTHWKLLALAFFLVPHGTAAFRNPWHEPRALDGESARRVLESVLTRTYEAFNLTDEDELYEQLEDNVSGDLVADLYLDSRRRLTVGTRAGAQITVREVSVLELGEAVAGADSSSGFSYPAQWVVIARVQHLQHVHHRRNAYTGILTIRVEDDRWKIAGVELTSEERVVVPAGPA